MLQTEVSTSLILLLLMLFRLKKLRGTDCTMLMDASFYYHLHISKIENRTFMEKGVWEKGLTVNLKKVQVIVIG